MPTPLYRFHCTDGRELVADLQGKRLPTWALMRLHAERVALNLMLASARRDWSAWTVEIYDVSSWLAGRGVSNCRLVVMRHRESWQSRVRSLRGLLK